MHVCLSLLQESENRERLFVERMIRLGGWLDTHSEYREGDNKKR